MPLTGFLLGRHKAERIDSVYLSKLRLAKKRQEAVEAEVQAEVVCSEQDTSAVSSPAEDSRGVEAEGNVRGSNATSSSSQHEDDNEETPGDADDDEPEVPEVTTRKDSVLLARERLSGARNGETGRLPKHDEDDEAEAEDVVTEIVNDDPSLKKCYSIGGRSLREPGTTSPHRPQSAMQTTRHSADGASNTVHFSTKRSQSIGHRQVHSANPRQRRASTGQHHDNEAGVQGLLHFLKQAFLPSSTHSHPPTPGTLKDSGSGKTSSSNRAAKDGGSGKWSSSERGRPSGDGGSGSAYGGSAGILGTSPPVSPLKESRSIARKSEPLFDSEHAAAASGTASGNSGDQNAVAAFFSKIHRATFKRRTSPERAQDLATSEA